MTRTARARLITVGGLLFGVGLLAVLIWRARLPLVIAALRDVSPGWLLGATVLKLSALGMKVARWHLTWRAAFRAPGEKLASATLLGFLLNATFPARLGDVARAQLAARANERTFSAALGSLVFDRALDALMLGVMVMLATATVTIPGLAHLSWAATMALVAPAAVVGIALVLRVGDWLPRPLRSRVEQFRAGVSAARSPATAALAGALTAVAWTLEVAGALLVLWSFHIPASPGAALVLTTATAVGLAVPSAPSGLGLHQAIYQVVLGQVGVAAPVAVAASIVSVGAMLITLACTTLIVLWIQAVPLSTLLPRAVAGDPPP